MDGSGRRREGQRSGQGWPVLLVSERHPERDSLCGLLRDHGGHRVVCAGSIVELGGALASADRYALALCRDGVFGLDDHSLLDAIVCSGRVLRVVMLGDGEDGRRTQLQQRYRSFRHVRLEVEKAPLSPVRLHAWLPRSSAKGDGPAQR